MTPTDPRILALTDALAAMHKRATEAETIHAAEAADLRDKLAASNEHHAECGAAAIKAERERDELRADLLTCHKRAVAVENDRERIRGLLSDAITRAEAAESALSLARVDEQARAELAKSEARAAIEAAEARIMEAARALVAEANARAEAAEGRLADAETAAFERGRAAGAEFAGSFAPAESRGAGVSDEALAEAFQSSLHEQDPDGWETWPKIDAQCRREMLVAIRVVADRARADERTAWQEATDCESPEKARYWLDDAYHRTRAAIGAEEGEHMVKAAARVVKERDEARQRLAELDGHLDTLEDIDAVLDTDEDETTIEAAERVVKERDSLRSELAALKAERDRLIASEGNIARERAQAEAEEERLAAELATLTAERDDFATRLHRASRAEAAYYLGEDGQPAPEDKEERVWWERGRMVKATAAPAVAAFDLPALEWTPDPLATRGGSQSRAFASAPMWARAFRDGWAFYAEGRASDEQAARATCERAHALLTGEATATTAPAPEPTPGPRYDVPQEVHDSGWQWRPVGDGAFAPPFGTIRPCRWCGCLVAGGPTACVRCVEAKRDAAPPPPKATASAPGIDSFVARQALVEAVAVAAFRYVDAHSNDAPDAYAALGEAVERLADHDKVKLRDWRVDLIKTPAPCALATVAAAPREVKRIAEDAVGDFIRGHARRISEQHDGCTDAVAVADFAAEVHDILNNLRADKDAEVYDGRPGRRAATGPTEPPAAREVTVEMLTAALREADRDSGVLSEEGCVEFGADMMKVLGRVSLPAVDVEALQWARGYIARTRRTDDDPACIDARSVASLDAIIAAQVTP